MTVVQRRRRRIRREAFEEAAHIAEGYLHIVPAEGGDEMDRIGRYSNGTVCRIADAIRAKGRSTSKGKP